MLKQKPLRVALLCSDRAPGARELLSDPERGRLFEIACVISTNRNFPERDDLVDAGITCITLRPPPADLQKREAYDRATAGYLKLFDVDLVVLCCYLRLLMSPMLEAFPNRIVNLHDSDLSLTNSDGARRYVGLKSTRDAIWNGETHTRATAHWVDDRIDGGPILTQTEPFEVAPLAVDALRWGAFDIIKAQAYAHREWVIRSAWGPLMKEVIHQVACGDAAWQQQALKATA